MNMCRICLDFCIISKYIKLKILFYKSNILNYKHINISKIEIYNKLLSIKYYFKIFT